MVFFKPVPEGSNYVATVKPVGPNALQDPVIKIDFCFVDAKGEPFVEGRASIVVNKTLKY